MAENIKQELERLVEITEVLYNEHFQLSDIGISSKIAHDWTKAGIYLRERTSKYRRKYNGLEYVWLKLVIELRGFGLSIPAIIQLRRFLLSEMDLIEFYKSLAEPEEDFGISDFRDEVEKLGGVVAIKEGVEIPLIDTVLSVLVSASIFGKSNTHLAITKSGSCYVFDEDPKSDLFVSDHVTNEPYISLPLNYIVKNFIWAKDLYELKEEDGLKDLSKDERKIINLMREGRIHSLYVKFSDNKVSLMEMEDMMEKKQTKEDLVDAMKRGNYQEISYKTEKGKTVSVKP